MSIEERQLLRAVCGIVGWIQIDGDTNVRELANFIERAVILSRDEELEVPTAELKSVHSREIAQASTFLEAERTVIIDALRAASGQISGNGGAAERFGLKRTTLQNKMRRLNIARIDYAN